MTEKSKSVVSRILNIAGWVLFGFLMLIIILLIFFGLMNRNSLFGLKAYVVLSDSMENEFPAGSVVFSTEVNPDELKVGDIITFTRESDGVTVTHKIGKIEMDVRTGYNVYYTYGTVTQEYDDDPVHRNFIQGKYSFHIVGLGYLLDFIKSPAGYIFLILIPFGVLIISQALRVMKNFRLYQEEGKSEIRTERQKLEDEREETRRLLDELKKMKEQLNLSQSENTTSTPSENTTSIPSENATSPSVAQDAPNVEQYGETSDGESVTDAVVNPDGAEQSGEVNPDENKD